MNIIYIGFIIKIILVILQLFFELPGTGHDAQSFHNEAVEFSEYIGSNNPLSEYKHKAGWTYSIFLGFIYSILGPSKIIGGVLSALTWFLSAVVFRKTLILLKLDNFKINLSILGYIILLPISFYYSSLMLREVYMLFFVNLLFLSIVNLALKEKFMSKIFDFLLFLLSIILLLSFHKANLYFCIIFLPFILIFLIFKYLSKINLKFLKIKKIYWVILFIFIIVLIIDLIIKNEILRFIFETIVNYQMGHFNEVNIFRADYLLMSERVNLDYSFTVFIEIFFDNIFNYLLQPTPFNITTLMDQVLFVENLIRFLILIIIIFNLFKNFQMKSVYFIGFMILIIMEIVYASGTVNWGSASRHHVPKQGILLLLLFFPKKKIMKN